jgi:hypothetical protein
MINKNTIILFFALTIGLWIGNSLPLFSDENSGSFLDELLKISNIVGALVGGTVGSIVAHFMAKRGNK